MGDPHRGRSLRKSTARISRQGGPGLRVGEGSYPQGGFSALESGGRSVMVSTVGGGWDILSQRKVAGSSNLMWGRILGRATLDSETWCLQAWCQVIQGGKGRYQGPQKCLESWVQSSRRTLSPADGSSRTVVPGLPWGNALR